MRIEQHFKERRMSMDADGEFTQVEVTYIVFDAELEEQALRGVHDYAPDEWEGLPMESLEILSRDSEDVFTVEVKYKHKESSVSSSKEKDEEEPTVSFDWAAAPATCPTATTRESPTEPRAPEAPSAGTARRAPRCPSPASTCRRRSSARPTPRSCASRR